MSKGCQLNKESGVSNEQRVSAEQGVRVSNEQGSQLNKEFLLNKGSQLYRGLK